MILLPDITELGLIGPLDANVPNQERLVFRASMNLELGYYCVSLGVGSPGTTLAVPVPGSMFVFPEAAVTPADWIFLYTGAGRNYVSTLESTDDRALVFYWGRPSTAFTHPQIVPMIFRLASILVGKAEQPQLIPNLSRRQS
jgi:hypothetical protein